MPGRMHILGQPDIAHVVAAIGQHVFAAPGGVVVTVQLEQLRQRPFFAWGNGA
ncbi:hypothetical protein D3C81_2036820 [compost metagenome]